MSDHRRNVVAGDTFPSPSSRRQGDGVSNRSTHPTGSLVRAIYRLTHRGLCSSPLHGRRQPTTPSMFARYFRRPPLTGHCPDTAKSTRMTRRRHGEDSFGDTEPLKLRLSLEPDAKVRSAGDIASINGVLVQIMRIST